MLIQLFQDMIQPHQFLLLVGDIPDVRVTSGNLPKMIGSVPIAKQETANFGVFRPQVNGSD